MTLFRVTITEHPQGHRVAPLPAAMAPNGTCQEVSLAGVGDTSSLQPAEGSPRARRAGGGYYRYNLNAVTSCAEGIKY